MPYSVGATAASGGESTPWVRARAAQRARAAGYLAKRPRTLSRSLAAAAAMGFDVAALTAVAAIVGTLGGDVLDAPIERAVAALSSLGVMVVMLMRFAGAYRFSALAAMSRRCLALAVALVGVGAVVVAIGIQGGGEHAIARLIGPWAALATATLLAGGFAIARVLGALRASGRFAPAVAIVCATEIAERLIDEARAAGPGNLDVVGIFDDRLNRVAPMLGDIPVLGSLDDLVKFDRIGALDWIVVALPWSAERRTARILDRLGTVPTRVLLAPDMVGFRYGRPEGVSEDELPLVEVLSHPFEGWRGLVKAIEDRVLAGLLLVALAPVLLAVAAWVRLDSTGPALRRERHAGGGRIFEAFKFRTLRAAHAYRDAAPVSADDPRLTRAGRFLRRTGLDGLPRLLNVVRGEMSLIGPVAHAAGAAAGRLPAQDILAEYARRRGLKPGITGWAQVNGGPGPAAGEAELRRSLEYDLEYINHWSLWLDALILLRTPDALLGNGRREPAYAHEARPTNGRGAGTRSARA